MAKTSKQKKDVVYVALPRLILLATAGVVLAAAALIKAHRDQVNRGKYTHSHYMNGDGEFVYADGPWLNGKHQCDGKFIIVPAVEQSEADYKINVNRAKGAA